MDPTRLARELDRLTMLVKLEMAAKARSQILVNQAVSVGADGYYRVSGRPMLAFTSIGPGQANTVVGMGTAYVDSTAVT